MNTTMRPRDARSRAGFESWVVAREGSLHRTARLLTKDPHAAQDLVQSTLAKLYLAWDRIDDRDHVDAYARKVLLNEFRGTWRRAWRRRELVTGEVPDRAAVETQYDGSEDAVWAFVNTLAPRQRAVIVLRYYEDLTEAQTAELLGISVGTVKSQAHRALASLRTTIHDHPAVSDREEDR